MSITPEVVRELLHYNPETGIFTWRKRDRKWFKTDRAWNIWNKGFVGKRAGSLSKNKYGYQRRSIRLLYKPYYEHVLAWLYMTDSPLPPEIDHRDRDATNNAWSNLRASSRADNAKNRSMRSDNDSGVTSVWWDEPTGKWRAQCKVLGNRVHLGLFEDIREASDVIDEFRLSRGLDDSYGKHPPHYRE